MEMQIPCGNSDTMRKYRHNPKTQVQSENAGTMRKYRQKPKPQVQGREICGQIQAITLQEYVTNRCNPLFNFFKKLWTTIPYGIEGKITETLHVREERI